MMNRKDSIKTMVLGALSLPLLKDARSAERSAADEGATNHEPLRSRWTEWPDMPWVNLPSESNRNN